MTSAGTTLARRSMTWCWRKATATLPDKRLASLRMPRMSTWRVSQLASHASATSVSSPRPIESQGRSSNVRNAWMLSRSMIRPVVSARVYADDSNWPCAHGFAARALRAASSYCGSLRPSACSASGERCRCLLGDALFRRRRVPLDRATEDVLHASCAHPFELGFALRAQLRGLFGRDRRPAG